MRPRRMSKGQAKRNFRKGARVHKRNFNTIARRGGIRL